VKLTHVRLLVDDVDACFRFYRDVMGFTPTWGAEDEGYADFDTGGGSALALFDRDAQADVVPLEESGDGAALVFGVADLDVALAELRERGAEPGPVTARPDWGIRFAHFRDPAGNLIEVNESIPMVDG
jgi:lactoylglutathione lyase